MSESIFDQCSSSEQGDEFILQCVADRLQEKHDQRYADLLSFELVIAGALVFFMQAGFAMLCAGSVRKKNVNNTMLKNLLDACGAGIAFYCTGFAFAFGDSGTGTTFSRNE